MIPHLVKKVNCLKFCWNKNQQNLYHLVDKTCQKKFNLKLIKRKQSNSECRKFCKILSRKFYRIQVLPHNIWKEIKEKKKEDSQSCPTLCDPIDGSPPGSPIPGILQARTLEWVAISFSNAWKWKVKVKLLSRVWLLVTPRTAAHQAPLSMGFSRQECWSGVPLPSPDY